MHIEKTVVWSYGLRKNITLNCGMTKQQELGTTGHTPSIVRKQRMRNSVVHLSLILLLIHSQKLSDKILLSILRMGVLSSV